MQAKSAPSKPDHVLRLQQQRIQTSADTPRINQGAHLGRFVVNTIYGGGRLGIGPKRTFHVH